jgi:integrase
MKLSDTTIRNAKPSAKPVRLFDGGGLYLEIAPSGGKLWRLKYRIAGKEKRLAVGVYPDVGLKLARQRRDEARELIAQGIDPSAAKQAAKASQVAAEGFETVAREWFETQRGEWVASHADKIIRRLERDVFPWIGKRPIAELAAPEILAALRRIEARGAVETAHRALTNIGQVFKYAIATGRATTNPARDLSPALRPVTQTHHASITDPAKIGGLLRAIDGYVGTPVVRAALQLAPLVFVRPGELRQADWAEFDLDAGEWRIPAARMKAREMHIVPLAPQAVAILREIHALTGDGRFVFPSARSPRRPMSNVAVLAALRRMGFASDEMTGHGFRSMASTLLNEQGWHRDAIERQLAHGERNKVRAAYNYAQHLPERRKMMRAWADYLDALKADEGAKVIPINARAKK